MTTAPTPIEAAEAAILRALRDADTAVPLADLDDIATRQTISAALTRLSRAGVIDVTNGHVSLSRPRIVRKPEPKVKAEPRPKPKPSPLRRAQPTTRDVLGMVIAELAGQEMTYEELAAAVPAGVVDGLDDALTYGQAIGALGRVKDRFFVARARRK